MDRGSPWWQDHAEKRGRERRGLYDSDLAVGKTEQFKLLRFFDEKNRRDFLFDDTYDYYAMTQKMRSMERAVRALKREREAYKALGMDTTEIQAKIGRKTAEYKAFCKECVIPEKTSRLRYECGTSDLKKTKAWGNLEVSVPKSQKSIAEVHQSDNINISEDKGNIEVHTVGKINRDIYGCITDDITTDEVIITDNRIQHIRYRHPNDYERFSAYFGEIVSNPDYIIETPKPNTALILKEIIAEGEKFKTVLRLSTSTDNKEYKNSIITFMKIDDKEWRRLLRNKRILYKKE
ncbi:MAG: phage minor capsid protein [Lachnospiraceae bacterium]